MRIRRVAALQTAPAFGEVARNLDAAGRLLQGLRADLVVLPELFATGYSFRDRAEVLSLAEPFPGGPTIERMRAWSAATGGVVVGGFPERAGRSVFNAAAVVVAGAALHSYRKIHLFGFEPEVFEPGDGGLALVEHEGFRVGVMICFDWIFPEVARALALAGADAIAHPSNLVLPFCQRAMPTRALENGVYTLTANRAGQEHRPPRPALRFTGGSLVVSPSGEVLARAGSEAEEVLVVEADASLARDKTLASGNDRLAERRPEHYRARVVGPPEGP